VFSLSIGLLHSISHSIKVASVERT